MKPAVLFLFILVNSIAHSQNISPGIKQDFEKNHPEIKNAVWKTDGENFSVTFPDNNNLRQTYLYNHDGKLIRSEHQLFERDIPKQVSDYYETSYPEERNFIVWLVEDSEVNKSYFSTYHNEKIFVDKEGKISQSVSPQESEH